MVAKVVGVDKSIFKRVTCRQCASVIEYTNVDTIISLNHDYDGGSDYNRRLICPNCNDNMIVSY
jgi:5-methylcytosine-specific restriction endonuclease McrA